MSNPAAVVMVTTSFPISSDGSEAAGSFVADLAEELARHLPVRVVAPGAVQDRQRWSSDVEVYRYTAPDKPLSTLKFWQPSDLLALRAVLRSGEVMTRSAVAAGPTAHILALWALPSGYWARRVAIDTGVAYSVWALGSDIWSLGRLPLVRRYLRRVLAGAEVCYADGVQLAEDASKVGCRSVEFLPSTRRIERVRDASLKRQPPYKFLFLGRWHPNKGVDLLIEALGLLSNEDWQCIDAVEICGGGPLEALVLDGARQLQRLGRPVSARGFLNKREAEDAIAGADYLLIPSRIESIPVVFSDAVKLGCPVLACPVGDLPALVGAPSPCGFTARDISATAFADIIVEATRARPAEFETGLQRMATRFDLESLAAQIALRHGLQSRE